jgi:Bacteriophage HK97-gp10, putative tail-component
VARRDKYTTRNAYRTIERIRRKAQERSEEIAQDIVDLIFINAPTGSAQRGTLHDDAGPELRESFYVRQDPETGDFLIRSRRRYWAYVEFGTREHGIAQPFIRPSVAAVKAYHR